MKSLTSNEKNLIEKQTHEKFFIFQKSNHDEQDVKMKFDLNRRSMNRNCDWFTKFYNIDVFNAISTFAYICEKTQKSNLIFSNFDDADDLNRLNDK